MEEAMKKKWQVTTTRLIISIGKQINMEKNDQILMMMCLNNPERVKKFSDWVRTKTVNNKVNSTPEEVVRAATRIYQGLKPLD